MKMSPFHYGFSVFLGLLASLPVACTVGGPSVKDSDLQHSGDDGDGDTDGGSDTDGDSDPKPCVDEDGDGAGVGAITNCPNYQEDCDDSNSSVHPGATEACDGLDNDCDREIDEGWIADVDGDGCAGAITSSSDCASALEGLATDPDETRLSWGCVGGVGTFAELTGYSINDFVVPGDLTGDGLSDLLIGTSDKALVALGPFSGTTAIDDRAWSLSCEGCAEDVVVSRAGDVDGDGNEDLLVGGSTSAAWLVMGPVTANVDLAADAVRLEGEETDDHFGMDVSPVGDNDGDGLDEFAVCAPDYWEEERVYDENDLKPIIYYWSGMTYLFEPGGTSPGTTLRPADSFASMTLYWVGSSTLEIELGPVVGGGDPNGDGYGDLAFTAYWDPGGKDKHCSLFFRDGPFSGDAVSLEFWLYMWYDHDSYHEMACPISPFADFDGDGYDDIVLGAPAAHGSEAIVVLGAAREFEYYKIQGDYSKYEPYFANSVGSMPDADGDGRDEVLVGPETRVYAYPDYGRDDERWYFTGAGLLFGGGDLDSDGLGELITSDGSTLSLISLAGL